MTILTIGSGHRDFSDFLRPKSRERIASYGALFDQSYIIAFTQPGFSPQTLSPNVQVFPTNSKSRFLAPIHAIWLGKDILKKIPKDEKVIISAQDPFESAFVAWWLARKFGLSLHIQLHTDFLQNSFKRERWENRIRYWLGLFLLPKADCIRVVSQRIERSLSRHFPQIADKITVLAIWTQSQGHVADAILNAPELSVLVVSRLEPEKAVGDAVKAFAGFLNGGGKGRLTIVGDGSEKKYLERLAKDLCPSGSVIFAGWQDELRNYYLSANVFLLASRYEGWGMSAAEAVGAGIPVVMTDVGLAGEVVKNCENGIIVPVSDVSALTEALLALFKDPGRRRSLSSPKNGPNDSRVVTRPKSWDLYFLDVESAIRPFTAGNAMP